MRVLLVEDEPAIARLLSEMLKEVDGSEFQTATVRRLSEALVVLAAGGVDLVLSDLSLPDSNGIDTVRRLHDAIPGVPIVVATSLDDEAAAIEALKAGAQDYLVKGLATPGELARAIRYAVERSQIDRRLVAYAQEVEGLYNRAPIGYHSLDEDRAFIQVNDTELEWLACTREEVIGKLRIDDFLTAEGRATLPASWAVFLERGEVRDLELDLVRKDGSILPILLSSTAEYAEDGRFQRANTTVFDRTRLKQTEDELISAREEADRANQAKSEFLSRMSHELRTPLNAILGFGQLLAMDPLEPQQANNVEEILSAGAHLLDLIDEVLDIARVEAGSIPISLESTSVREAVLDAMRMVVPLGSDRGIQYDFESEHDPDVSVEADVRRLRQVLLNLLSNAVKYNRDHGLVRVRYARAPEGTVRIDVEDTGPGIAPESLERIFVPFERAGADSTDIKGTGLGLTLTRHLVEAMGGSITTQSKVGVGSTFSVTLPLVEEARAADEIAAEAQERVSAGPRTILYIENDLSNIHLVQNVLKLRPGIKLFSSMLGRVGLEMARTHTPNAILLDLDLPDMGGAEILKTLRGRSETRYTPVIILTADANPATGEALLVAGADAFLTKPLDVGTLLRSLDGFIDVAE